MANILRILRGITGNTALVVNWDSITTSHAALSGVVWLQVQKRLISN